MFACAACRRISAILSQSRKRLQRSKSQIPIANLQFRSSRNATQGSLSGVTKPTYRDNYRTTCLGPFRDSPWHGVEPDSRSALGGTSNVDKNSRDLSDLLCPAEIYCCISTPSRLHTQLNARFLQTRHASRKDIDFPYCVDAHSPWQWAEYAQ